MGTVSRVHTFSSGAVLTAAQLNTEFDNLLTSSAINGGLNATNLGVTAGQVTASKALVVDSSRDLDDTTSSNMVNNLTLSGTLKLLDNKSLTLGTDSNITVQYDETTNDALEIAAAVEGAALGIVLKSDQGDDAGDEWKLNVADGGTLTLGNDIASAGTYVSGLTITPHATTASWLLDFEGDVDVGGDTLSFNGAATIDTSGNNNLTLSAGTATLGVTAGDVTVYDDNNNADTSLSIGTSATEALVVQALNGASNKTLEELRFTTKTASGTANHGKMSFYVDEVNIGNVNDGGITLESGMVLTGNVTGNASGTAATVTGGTQAAITTCTNLVTTGALNSGSITSGFGTINNGSSTITTTGALAAGATTLSGDTVVGNGYNLIVGHSSQLAFANSSEVQVLGTGSGDSRIALGAFINSTVGPGIEFLKSRNGTIGSNTIVQDDDDLGDIVAYVDDGTDFGSRAGYIRFQVDGTPGANDTPGRIIFGTTADGAAGETERLRIDSSGRILAGTTSTYNADYDNLVVASTANTGVTIASTSTTATTGIAFADGTDSGNNTRAGLTYDHNAGLLKVNSNNATAMVFDTNQKVGIGTAAPGTNLHVSNGGSAQAVAAPGMMITNSASSGDNVGLSLASGTAGKAYMYFGDSADDAAAQIWYDNNTDDLEFNAAESAGQLIFKTASTERMRIATGKVGINISDPADYTDASGAVLVVGNTSGTTTRSGVSIITDTSGIGRLAFGDGAGDPDQWKGYIQYTQSSDTMGFACNGQAVEMSLVGGNVGIAMTPGGSHKLDVTGSAGLSTGTAWTNTSDARIKTDVATITGATAKLKRLRPVSYKYTDQYLSVHSEISGSKTYHSFIADEYETVFPDAVSVQGDLIKTTPATYYADGDDLPSGKSVGDEKTAETSETLLTNLKQYTPHDLQMFVVAAVQELDARIAALEAA